ncbi:unnamed protein product [Brassica oleracea]
MDKIDDKFEDLTSSDIQCVLGRLHMFLWPGSKWQQPDLKQLFGGDKTQIKRIYRKALLYLHPDKHAGASAEQKYWTQQIFKIVQVSINISTVNPIFKTQEMYL